MRRSSQLMTSMTLAVALAQALSAGAQETQDFAQFRTLDPVMVTTQKRTQSVFDVPITVTAYDAERLELFSVEAFDDLSKFVPGLNVQLQSPNNPGWVIRGITTDSGNFQDPPRVSIYLNGVDVSRSRGSAFEIFDVERIEVVKGPQATLFGTAASVGAISVITAKPEEDFSGAAYASYGSYDSTRIGGHVTGGTAMFQARLAAQYRSRDGFVSNIAGEEGSNSFSSQDDLNGVGAFAIRPSLSFTPNEEFRLDLVYNYEKNDRPGTAFKSGVIAPSGGDTDPSTFAELGGAFGNPLLSFDDVAFTPGGIFPVLNPLAEGSLEAFLGEDELGLEREIHDINATAEWQLNEAFSLTAIAGYREFDSLEVFDADGSQVPLVESAEDSEGEQTSFELRVNFDNGSRLRGFAGVSYFEEEGFQRVPFAIDETIFGVCLAANQTGFGITPVCVNPDGSFNRLNLDPATAQFQPIIPATAAPGVFNAPEFTNDGEAEVFSVFADVSYDLTDALELTAGLRVIDEERTSGFSSSFPDSFLLLSQSLVELQTRIAMGEQVNPDDVLVFAPILQGFADTRGERIASGLSETAVLPRFNALWTVNPDLNLYATISQGRRSPVFSITQQGAFDPATGTFVPNVEEVEEEIVWNYEAGLKSSLYGGRLLFEGAAFFQAYDDFRVQLANPATGLIQNESAGEAQNFGIELASEVRPTEGLTFIGTFAYLDAQIDDNASNGDLAGNQFRLQPEYSGSLTGDYRRFVTPNLEGFATVNLSYRSEVFFEADNNPLFSEDDVTTVDVEIGVARGDGLWQFSLFGDNVFDEDYIIDAGNTGRLFGSATFIPAPPAFWGAEFRTRF